MTYTYTDKHVYLELYFYLYMGGFFISFLFYFLNPSLR